MRMCLSLMFKSLCFDECLSLLLSPSKGLVKTSIEFLGIQEFYQPQRCSSVGRASLVQLYLTYVGSNPERDESQE